MRRWRLWFLALSNAPSYFTVVLWQMIDGFEVLRAEKRLNSMDNASKYGLNM